MRTSMRNLDIKGGVVRILKKYWFLGIDSLTQNEISSLKGVRYSLPYLKESLVSTLEELDLENSPRDIMKLISLIVKDCASKNETAKMYVSEVNSTDSIRETVVSLLKYNAHPHFILTSNKALGIELSSVKSSPVNELGRYHSAMTAAALFSKNPDDSINRYYSKLREQQKKTLQVALREYHSMPDNMKKICCFIASKTEDQSLYRNIADSISGIEHKIMSDKTWNGVRTVVTATKLRSIVIRTTSKIDETTGHQILFVQKVSLTGSELASLGLGGNKTIYSLLKFLAGIRSGNNRVSAKNLCHYNGFIGNQKNEDLRKRFIVDVVKVTKSSTVRLDRSGSIILECCRSTSEAYSMSNDFDKMMSSLKLGHSETTSSMMIVNENNKKQQKFMSVNFGSAVGFNRNGAFRDMVDHDDFDRDIASELCDNGFSRLSSMMNDMSTTRLLLNSSLPLTVSTMDIEYDFLRNKKIKLNVRCTEDMNTSDVRSEIAIHDVRSEINTDMFSDLNVDDILKAIDFGESLGPIEEDGDMDVTEIMSEFGKLLLTDENADYLFNEVDPRNNMMVTSGFSSISNMTTNQNLIRVPNITKNFLTKRLSNESKSVIRFLAACTSRENLSAASALIKTLSQGECRLEVNERGMLKILIMTISNSEFQLECCKLAEETMKDDKMFTEEDLDAVSNTGLLMWLASGID